KVIDVRKLYGQTGYFTYDPGFMATAACRSSITYIDGDEGILLYRGYPIQELAAKSDFMEVSYLLLYGELPTAKQKEQFVYDIIHDTMVHAQISTFFRGFRRDAHPMPIMSRTRRPRRCAMPDRAAPIRSPASPPASPRYGDRRMAAPMRRC